MINKIKQKNWRKNWEGKFSFLLADLAVDCYYIAGEIFKSELSVLMIFKKGITSCYLDERELNIFGKKALRKIKKIGVKKFVDDFKKSADKVYGFLNSSPERIFEKFEYIKFEKILDEYTSYQITNKEVVNHLIGEDLRYFKYFEGARKYSERIFVDFEKYLSKVDIKGINLFTKNEFENFFIEKKLLVKNVAKKRFNNFGVFIEKNKRFYLDQKKINEIEKYWKKNLKVNKIVGSSAYRGVVRGRVKVLIDLKEKKTFKRGNILVTGMTDPNFVPIINKSIAIITDAGGLLCHAAIVSREMKKPCIIGTKIATQVLKDGDLVEVDANNGVVKIIK